MSAIPDRLIDQYTNADRLQFLVRTGHVVHCTCAGDKFYHGKEDPILNEHNEIVRYPTKYFDDPWSCLENLMVLQEVQHGKKYWMNHPRGTDGVKRFHG